LFGGVGTAVTYIFWNKGVQLIGAEKAGMFMNIVPLSTALISVVIGQSIGVSHLIAGIMILGSVFVVGK
jgi:drug/metabolite transporter (DMT)-like permease